MKNRLENYWSKISSAFTRKETPIWGTQYESKHFFDNEGQQNYNGYFNLVWIRVVKKPEFL